MKKNIVIIGSSGHARVVIDIVEKQNNYNIVGLIDPFRRIGEKTSGYNVIGKIENIIELYDQYRIDGCIVAIGDNWVRHNEVERLVSIKDDICFINAIHPSAQIGSNVKIGTGTVIMAGAIVNSNSSIGSHIIINTKASIDHDCVLADYSSLAPNSTLAGAVKIGSYTAVSLSATIVGSVNLGEHCLIGACSLILHDVDSYKLVYGVPGRIIRDRKPGEKYL
ncbi:MAG: acetyltransferase [Bacteroidota bacterium]